MMRERPVQRGGGNLQASMPLPSNQSIHLQPMFFQLELQYPKELGMIFGSFEEQDDDDGTR